MALDVEAEHLLIVSSDGHVGPRVEDYRPYVDPSHRADFEDYSPTRVALTHQSPIGT